MSLPAFCDDTEAPHRGAKMVNSSVPMNGRSHPVATDAAAGNSGPVVRRPNMDYLRRLGNEMISRAEYFTCGR